MLSFNYKTLQTKYRTKLIYLWFLLSIINFIRGINENKKLLLLLLLLYEKVKMEL